MTDARSITTRRVRTNDELAEALGISFTMASRLRNGKRFPSIAVMRKIQQEFGIPLEEQVSIRERGLDAWGEFMRARIYVS